MHINAALPVHPRTGLTAIGVLPSGRIVWPVLGASDDPPPGDGGEGKPATGDPAPPQPPKPAMGDKGYPENTPVAEMTPDQQAAYWKDKARKHEQRAKEFGGLTPEELAQLREAATELDKIRDANRSELEKAAGRADKATQRAAEAEQQAATANLELARLRAAVAKGLPEELGARLLGAARRIVGATPEELEADATDYFTASPIQVAPTPPPTPPGLDQGNRNTPPVKPSVAAGRDLYEQRRKKTAST